MKLKKKIRLTRTERFKKGVLELDKRTREKLKKQLALLLSNPRHPSLAVKKIKGTRSIFEARVNSKTSENIFKIRFLMDYKFLKINELERIFTHCLNH